MARKEVKISFNMATYPKRMELSQKTIQRILPQCDILRIYLNEYTEVPDFLRHNKIEVILGGENLKDTGKFFWANTLKSEYYFTCDDDIFLPLNYARNTIEEMTATNSLVCTCHGRILKQYPKSGMDAQKHYFFYKNQDYNKAVNYCGTGITCFDNSKLAVPLEIFNTHGMADEYFSLYLQEKKIPILCRKHEAIPLIKTKESLWNQRESYREDVKNLFYQTKWEVYV